MNLDIELVSDRPANRSDDLLGHRSVEMPIEFLYDRELFLSVDLDGEGRGTTCTERRDDTAPLSTRRPGDRRSVRGG